MAVQGFTIVFANNVGMLLKDRNDLLARRNALAFQHATLGLIHDPQRQRKEAVQVGCNSRRREGFPQTQGVENLRIAQELASGQPAPVHFTNSDPEQISVSPLPIRRFLGIENFLTPPLCPPRSIPENHLGGTE